MSHIYIALVDTPGFFAALIRRYVKQRYIHVVISEEPTFKEAYSVGTVSYTHLTLPTIRLV